MDGTEKVKLFGEEVSVNAEVVLLPGISGHADMNGLIEWLGAIEEKPEMVFVNHGESSVCDSFVKTLETEHGYCAFAPYSGTVFDLKENIFIECPEGIPVKKVLKGQARSIAAYEKLTKTADRLYRVAETSKGISNKDMARFTSQIEALIDKWQR